MRPWLPNPMARAMPELITVNRVFHGAEATSFDLADAALTAAAVEDGAGDTGDGASDQQIPGAEGQSEQPQDGEEQPADDQAEETADEDPLTGENAETPNPEEITNVEEEIVPAQAELPGVEEPDELLRGHRLQAKVYGPVRWMAALTPVITPAAGPATNTFSDNSNITWEYNNHVLTITAGGSDKQLTTALTGSNLPWLTSTTSAVSRADVRSIMFVATASGGKVARSTSRAGSPITRRSPPSMSRISTSRSPRASTRCSRTTGSWSPSRA